MDSTRLQSELAKHFGVNQSEVSGCITLGGHGEKMVPVCSEVKIAGTPLTKYLGTDKLTKEQFEEIKQKTIQVVLTSSLFVAVLHSRALHTLQSA